MNHELDEVLKRIDSRLLSKLWTFYRDYFSDDNSCLHFIYDCLKHEPIINGLSFRESEEQPEVFIAESGETINEHVFIPRRMLNIVERMVNAAKDMELIRRGKDVFKVVLLVACVETLQQLSGKTGLNKKDMLFSFFDDNTSEEDKCYISERFGCIDDEKMEEGNTFQQFIGVLNEYRNCAAHEGEYWDYCFNNNADRDEYPALLSVIIDLDKFTRNNKEEHFFHTKLSYSEFEAIFVRTCISFIMSHISELNST